MIPKECKRLVEVDFPIADVSKHALAEKARRIGTPHQLHLWWAWRPLVACRAVLLGLLLPDPCDPKCPADFKVGAWALLRRVGARGSTELDLRLALLKFIGDYANWDASANATYLEVSRGLVKAAHPEELPLVVDPFAGAGSIPLEAMRLGCETFASDLNPVAHLILAVLLEDIPRKGHGLAGEMKKVGGEIRKDTMGALAGLYPADSDGSRPIAYLWARTVRCETPGCGAEIPLVRSFWLARKKNRRRAFRYHVGRPPAGPPEIQLEIFEPKAEGDVPKATVSDAKATCPACHVVLGQERVRAQLVEQRGGADVRFDDRGHRVRGARLLAVVTLRNGEPGRQYRLPNEQDYASVRAAVMRLQQLLSQKRDGVPPIPDEPLPPVGTLGFRVQRYGMVEWGDLFTARQKVLSMLASVIRQRGERDLHRLLAMICSKLADRCSSLVNWSVGVECPNQVFKSNALPMAWDFCESNLLSESSGSIQETLGTLVHNAEATRIEGVRPSSPSLADARISPLPDETAQIWMTDPPYYDAVPYADLSDFFFVWLKRALPQHMPLRDPFDSGNPLTPKSLEIVQDASKRISGQPKDRAFFEESMARAFAEGRRVLRDDGLGCVVFAHKTTEGWEALLSGMIGARWVITASWPIATERSARVRARESAALGSSVHLVCRARPDDAPVGDWADVLRELPRRVGDWMERLQREGVRGADLVFACIGPALEIFSRYSRVETAEGREVPLAEYLEKVWEVVGRAALEQVLGTAEARARNGGAGALEEDARLTALFLWTVQSTTGGEANGQKNRPQTEDELFDEDGDDAPRKRKQGLSLIFDVARRFAQPLGIHLPEWEGRIVETEKGVVRLLPVRERARQLFGEDGPIGAASRIERDPRQPLQLGLFGEEPPPGAGDNLARAPIGPTRRGKTAPSRRDPTTLDRVHTAMLLQAAGQPTALRALIQAEQDRGPDFLRLANALSALYPRGSEEKRLLDAMLLAVPR